MSRDARYIIHYAPNVDNPEQYIHQINSNLDVIWQDRLTHVMPYEWYGETKHTHDDYIRLVSRADQILASYDGDTWEDITKKSPDQL